MEDIMIHSGEIIRIMACFAGVGKTTLAEQCPEMFIDLVCMPYKYYLTESGEEFIQSEAEASKANFDNIMQEDWPDNYVEAIKKAMCDDKILLIPSVRYVLARLREENIPYYLCYPQRDAKEIYRMRYISRGNSEDFLYIFIDGWDRFMDALEGDTYGCHIILQPHQFLADVVELVQ